MTCIGGRKLAASIYIPGAGRVWDGLLKRCVCAIYRTSDLFRPLYSKNGGVGREIKFDCA